MRILCVGSHPDDVELGCGGTVSRLKREKYGYVPTLNSQRFISLGMKKELRKAWDILGIKQTSLPQDHQGRDFDRQKILDDLILLRNEIKPNLVITHGANDVHQDHKVLHEESVRAFKHSSILGYTFPWNELCNNYTYFSELSAKEVETKLKALACYKTQKHRPYFNEDYQRSLLISNGLRINKPFAEAFEVIRWIQ